MSQHLPEKTSIASQGAPRAAWSGLEQAAHATSESWRPRGNVGNGNCEVVVTQGFFSLRGSTTSPQAERTAYVASECTIRRSARSAPQSLLQPSVSLACIIFVFCMPSIVQRSSSLTCPWVTYSTAAEYPQSASGTLSPADSARRATAQRRRQRLRRAPRGCLRPAPWTWPPPPPPLPPPATARPRPLQPHGATTLSRWPCPPRPTWPPVFPTCRGGWELGGLRASGVAEEGRGGNV
eukprot:scaffold52945_cov62-Phaeocystis_antarctica.AAC.3